MSAGTQKKATQREILREYLNCERYLEQYILLRLRSGHSREEIEFELELEVQHVLDYVEERYSDEQASEV